MVVILIARFLYTQAGWMRVKVILFFLNVRFLLVYIRALNAISLCRFSMLMFF
ncbi:protein of unknown function [Candidatus Nitrosocosmicus franklandus]|uniref:Uncharacterized protein n=1 Tax=Candidatus Nitrosocosmicus franklandianus TaxID=1798806 RepID=A0A484IBU4_9ARCH|nr:protein of unknown function [Candidatus Nitrosocosmicus franklandus]